MSQDTVLHVSTQGHDRWSGRLPEPAPDGRDGPFATIGRALHLRRRLTGPVRIRLRGGTYFLPEPLVLTARDSGTEKQPVIIAACTGEQPIISGGRRIENWSKDTVNGRPCWVAALPAVAAGGWNFTQLFVNGVRRPRPRRPRAGYYSFTGVPRDAGCGPGWKGPAAALFAGTDIQPWKNLADVRLIALQLWFENHHRLRAVDPAGQRVSFRAPNMGNLTDEKIPGAYGRYFIENVFEALENPGEWYLDRPAGKLYYLPRPGESPVTAEVIAPRLATLVRLAGTPRRPVRHIRLENLAFQHAEWEYPADDPGSIQAAFKLPGAVVFDHAEDCVLYGCEVAHVAQYGVAMTTGGAGNRVVACSIHDLGAGGVRLGHEWLTRTNETSLAPIKPRRDGKPMGAVVSDCEIHDGGLLHPSAIGIWIGNSGRNRIRHNHIFNFNYTGISCGWTWGYAPTATIDNRIEDNHIHHINWDRVLSDNGGIYTLGVQPGTIVRGNHIHHIGRYGYGGWGIYPDEGSSEILYESNLVHHTDEAGFSTHYGRDNIARNNIFALAARQQVNPGTVKVGLHRTTIFERNIVCWRTGGGLPPNDWRVGCFLFRDNLFWNGGGPLDFGNGTTLREWQKVGQHCGTLVADPLLADPEAGAGALRADSPAFRLGFRSVDGAAAGPRWRGRRPAAFAAWPAAPEPRRPIIRTRLEHPDAGTIRVTVENVGNAPAAGRLLLRAAPPALAAMGRPAVFTFRRLQPGSAKSAAFPITIAPEAESIWVETVPAGGDIFPALQFFVLHEREPEWRIPRLAPQSSVAAARTALAGLRPRELKFLDRTIAEVRAAVAGDSLALSATVVDAEPTRGNPLGQGSCLRLFYRDGHNPYGMGQVFLVPATKAVPVPAAERDGVESTDIRVTSTLTAAGYEITALLPLVLLQITPATREFLLELVVSTTLQEGGGRGCFHLFGDRGKGPGGNGATIIVADDAH